MLHEQVPNLRASEVDLVLASAGELLAIAHGDSVITQPEGGPLRANEAPMTADAPQASTTSDAPGVRSTVYYPDRQTSLEANLPYFEVFSPSITPFKRVSAFDRVVLGADGRTPGLTTTQSRRLRVTIEKKDATAPDPRARDQFWANVVLDFSAGDAVPLPSVSPESRILSMSSEPTIPLRIEKDAADNYFAVRTTRNTPAQVRVTFITDAPRSYFGTPVPSTPANALRDQVVALEASIQRRAERFAGELGVHADDPLPDVLNVLTAHFRSFVESKDPPTNTGDTYLDLARGKKGICRHRAYAFVITAQALGIPARFVQNEAHSWVEVKLPELGWMRIDLGGAAHGLDAQNADDQPAYQPHEADPLPRPAAYEAAYAQAQQRQRERQQQQVAQHTRDDLTKAAGRWVETQRDQPANDPNARTGIGLTEVESTETNTEGKIGLRIALDRVAGSIYRGGTLRVSGRVTDDSGTAVADMRVETALRQGQDRNLLLGVTVSDAQGYFQGNYGIPLGIDVGDYELRVISPGDDRYLPAIAR